MFVTATANDGAATFSNLSYNKAETITLVFTSPGLTSANSGNIIVSPAAASLLSFTTQAGSATYGAPFGQQPVVKSQDAFGNNSTVGLPGSKMVSISLTGGSGALSGTMSLDIGTNTFAPGIAAFTDLQINAAGSGKQLTASAPGLSSGIGTAFTVSPATVTGSITANNKVYDSTVNAGIATRLLSGNGHQCRIVNRLYKPVPQSIEGRAQSADILRVRDVFLRLRHDGPVEIGAERDVVDPHARGEMVDMADDLAERRVRDLHPVLTEERDGEVDTDDAAGVTDRVELGVGQVP